MRRTHRDDRVCEIRISEWSQNDKNLISDLSTSINESNIFSMHKIDLLGIEGFNRSRMAINRCIQLVEISREIEVYIYFTEVVVSIKLFRLYLLMNEDKLIRVRG